MAASNAGLYGWFFRHGGTRFTLAAVPLHLCYYLSNAVAGSVATLAYLVLPRVQYPSDASRLEESLAMDAWLRDAAPSAELRQWFSHDPAKWKEFRRRYEKELAAHPEAWQEILQAARRGRVTLLYSARDTEHNSALLLKEFLERKL